MTFLTVQDQVASVLVRWRAAYRYFPNGDSKHKITRKLEELETPSKQAIDEIIGNSTWTELYCEECHHEVSKVALLNEEGDGGPYRICGRCLCEAAKLLVNI